MGKKGWKEEVTNKVRGVSAGSSNLTFCFCGNIVWKRKFIKTVVGLFDLTSFLDGLKLKIILTEYVSLHLNRSSYKSC